MKSIKSNIKSIIIAITFLSIITTGIIFKQQFIMILPLIVSIAVMFLSSRANRYSYLVGGLNSIIYAVVYWLLARPASALYALGVSFPMQIIIFINWSRHSYKNSTTFRKMPTKIRFPSAILYVIVCMAICFITYSKNNSVYSVLDSMSAFMGITVTILTIFAFVEITYLNIISGLISIALDSITMMSRPAHITYLIFSIYSMWAIIMAFININKLYKIQTIEKSGEK